MEEYLLIIKDLKTYFHTFAGVVRAVDGVSFSLPSGGILGIVGESGCGKSVLGFSILKLIEHPGRIESGSINFAGRDLLKVNEKEMQQIRGKHISMIFQDPMTSLNPVFTVQNQIEEILLLHADMNRSDRKARCVELLTSVGIPEPEKRLKSYPHQFSGGMRQRVMIAAAVALSPKLIIADEPTTALDVTIQIQVLKLLTKLVRQNNASLMLITHDLAVVSESAERIIVMYCGKIVESGFTNDILNRPVHPYTKGLLASIPKIDEEISGRLNPIPGIVPDILNLPEGCKFAPRCKYAREKCKQIEPELKNCSSRQAVACHFPLFEAQNELFV
jgi:oligopeptide/dipeptide ABC transporter ATP-binding protein